MWWSELVVLYFMLEIANWVVSYEYDFFCKFQIGKTKVFLRAGQMAELDTRRSEVLGHSANIIQRKVRSYLARQWFISQQKSAIQMQSICRGNEWLDFFFVGIDTWLTVLLPVILSKYFHSHFRETCTANFWKHAQASCLLEDPNISAYASCKKILQRIVFFVDCHSSWFTWDGIKKWVAIQTTDKSCSYHSGN